jgi:hypothetical protein
MSSKTDAWPRTVHAQMNAAAVPMLTNTSDREDGLWSGPIGNRTLLEGTLAWTR